MNTIRQLESEAQSLLKAAGLPVNERAAENILSTINSGLIQYETANQERAVLAASLAAEALTRAALVPPSDEEVIASNIQTIGLLSGTRLVAA